MLKKLYGLFIYRLQATSFFSIMERVSGFVLLVVLYYFFMAEFILNTSFNNYLIKILNNFSVLILLLMSFFFVFHLVNGLRIYTMSFYYYINLKKKSMLLENFYSFLLLEKNIFVKSVLLNLKKILNFFKLFLVKSNLSFLFFIFISYIIFILLFLI